MPGGSRPLPSRREVGHGVCTPNFVLPSPELAGSDLFPIPLLGANFERDGCRPQRQRQSRRCQSVLHANRVIESLNYLYGNGPTEDKGTTLAQLAVQRRVIASCSQDRPPSEREGAEAALQVLLGKSAMSYDMSLHPGTRDIHHHQALIFQGMVFSLCVKKHGHLNRPGGGV